MVTVAQTMLDESGYTEMWQQDKSPEAPGRLENLKEFVRALADFETLAGFLDHVSLVMENEENRRGRPRQPDDPARRQGAGVRHGVPAGLGGRRCSPTSVRWTRAARRGSRRNAGSPMSASRGRASARSSATPRTGASTPTGRAASPAASSTNCRKRKSSAPARPRWRATRGSPRRRCSPAPFPLVARRPARDRGLGAAGAAGAQRGDPGGQRACSTRNSATARSPRADDDKLDVAFDKAGAKRVLDRFVQLA